MADRTHGVATAAQLTGLSGREVLQAIIDGRFPQPPIAEALTFWLVEVGEGFAAFEGETGPHLLNPLGGVHGGWAFTLLDSATGSAALSSLPPGVGCATIEMNGNLTRPISARTGRVRAEGRVVSAGTRVITCEGWLRDVQGRILAHGTSTVLVFRPAGS